MRIVVTTLLVFFLGFFAGSLAAQILAVSTGADQEFIAVFFLVALFVLVSTVVFLVAQFFPDPRRASTVAMLILIGLILLAFVGLLVADYMATVDTATAKSGLPVIAGLTLPNAAVVLVQWLIVRWRNRDTPASMLFGRGPGAPA